MKAFEPKNPKFRERILKKLEGQHFMRHIGFEVTTIEAGCVEGEMELQPFHRQQFDILHGGVTATIADIVMGFCAYTMAPEEKDVVTGDIRISYLRPGKGQKVRAVGKILKPGNQVTHVEGEVYVISDGKEILIAKASTAMVLIDRVYEY